VNKADRPGRSGSGDGGVRAGYLKSNQRQQIPSSRRLNIAYLFGVFVMATVLLTAWAMIGFRSQFQSGRQSDSPSYNSALPVVPTGQASATPPSSTAIAVSGTAPPGTATPSEATVTPITPVTTATYIAHETAIAEFRSALGTSVALTAAPTNTPGTPPVEPSPTPILGMLPGCSSANPYEPQAISCWRGVANGQLVFVGAGREGSDGDVTQGILLVHAEGQEVDDIYQTPNRVGAVGIGSVSTITDTLFTLSTIGQPTPQEFVFDLNTRQWVSR
jgi:hypothetical protein